MGNKIIIIIIIKGISVTSSLGTIDGSRRKFARGERYKTMGEVNVNVNLGNILIESTHVNRRERELFLEKNDAYANVPTNCP